MSAPLFGRKARQDASPYDAYDTYDDARGGYDYESLRAEEMGDYDYGAPQPSARRQAPASSSSILARLAGVLLAICGGAARLLGWVYLAAAAVDVPAWSGQLRSLLLQTNSLLAGYLPASLAGTLVSQSPLGGTIRGDFIVAAVALFVVGFVLRHLSRKVGGAR